jgi:hypothetical protein
MLVLQVCSAQERPREVRFALALGDAPLRLGEEVGGWDLDTVAIDVFKFYISNMVLLHEGKAVWTDVGGPHLIDASDSSSLIVPLVVPEGVKSEWLRFTLGIDSTTNVSGAMGGDLDPTKGMYWTWQSGYVNLKVEGRSPLVQSKDKRFQFHLGGYQPPFQCTQEVKLPIGSGDIIWMGVDIAVLVNGINLSKQRSIMSPGADAVRLSLIARSMFNTDGR